MESPESDTSTDFFAFSIENKEQTVKEKTAETLAPLPYATHYNMNHSKRGIAIIFNHVIFSLPECSERQGSNKDTHDLEEVLHELGFDVHVHNDKTMYEICSTLKTVSEMDHSNSDCLLMVVMTHGTNGRLYAKDRTYPTKTLWANFNARNCPTLAGKPKLFFIQACRGENTHLGYNLRSSTRIEEDGGSSNDVYYSIPVMADILVMYSTVEGFYSWRHPDDGSYFIQALVRQLKKHYKSENILTILTFVSQEVAIDFTAQNSKQMTSVVSMLTRLLCF